MTQQPRLCYDCAHDLPHEASFCPNCGRHIRKRQERLDEDAKRNDRRAAEELSSSLGREAHERFRADLMREAAKRNPVILAAVSIFGLVAVTSSYLNLGHSISSIFGVLAIICLTLLVNPHRWLSEAEYYSFPGSRFSNGKHRCIFCGGRGIHREGEYKTTNKYARCSKCESDLFSE